MNGSMPRTKVIMEERRKRAEEVQAKNKRTPQEQLAHLDKLGLIATRERLKLGSKIQKVVAETPKGK